MAVPAKGPSSQKPKKVSAARSTVRQGQAVKDKENTQIGGQRSSSQEGATPPAVTPAKRGRPAKGTKAPPPQTSPDQTQQAVLPASIPAGDSIQLANKTELENIALQKKISEMEAQMKSNETGAETIRTILKPNGEAGDKQNGFVLRDAMELSETPEKQQIYLTILRSARRNIVRANLDIAVDFRRQDHEKLGQVFKMTRKENPYLDRARFPRDWATAEIVKQYLRNQRKRAKKPGRNQRVSNEDDGDDEAARRNGGDENENENEDEDEDENGGDGGREDGEGKEEELGGERKRRRVERS